MTHAERMQALTGVYPELARDIQHKISGEEGFGRYLEWSDGRGRDFQCIASMIYLVDSKPKVKFPSSPVLDKWLHDAKHLDDNLRRSVMETFDIFIILAKDSKYNEPLQSPKVSPVEFTMSAVLIHRCKATHSMGQLSASIKRMRANVRARHADIRSNQRVTDTMITFINNETKRQKDRADDDVPAVDLMKKRRKLKRKRDDCDDEGHPKSTKPSKPSSSKATVKGVEAQVAKRSQPIGKSASTPNVSTSSKSRNGSGVTVQSVPVSKGKTSSLKAPSSSTPQSSKAQVSSPGQASSSKTPLRREEDGKLPKKRARPSSPGPNNSRPPSAPNSRAPSVPPVVVKTEPSSKPPALSTPAPKVDRLAAIRRAKEDQKQRRQSSISLPPTPVTPSQPAPSFLQQPQAQTQTPAQPSLPSQPAPSASASHSPASTPSAQTGTGTITLSDGQQISEQRLKQIIAHYSQSQSPQTSGTPYNASIVTTDPRLKKTPSDHLTPSTSRKSSPKPEDKMEVDPSAPSEPASALTAVPTATEIPPIGSTEATAQAVEIVAHPPQTSSEQSTTIENQASTDISSTAAPKEEPQKTPTELGGPVLATATSMDGQPLNPLSFLRQSSAVSAHISSVQQNTNSGMPFPTAALSETVGTCPSSPIQPQSLLDGRTQIHEHISQNVPTLSNPIRAKQEYISPTMPLSPLPPISPSPSTFDTCSLPRRPNKAPPIAPRADIASTLAIPAHADYTVKRESPATEWHSSTRLSPTQWSPARDRRRWDPSDPPTHNRAGSGDEYGGRWRPRAYWDTDRNYRGQRGSRSPQRYRGRASSPGRGSGYYSTRPQ